MKHFAILFTFIILVLNVNSQVDKKLSNWYINGNAGGTLFWGDLSDDVTNPFSKYFTNQQGYAGGLTLTRNFFSFIDINAQFTAGTLRGNRTKWSHNIDADFSFKSSYQEFNLNVGFDLIKMIPAMNDFNLFYPYLKGGVGYTFFNAEEKNMGLSFSKSKGQTAIIVWGGGLKVPINKHYSAFFETSFHHSNSDLLDSHDGLGSDVNDIYTYTSLGVIYRFNARPKKPKLDILIEEPIDTIVATNSIINEPKAEQKVDINVQVNPGFIYQNDTFIVQIRINKHILAEKARIQQTLPIGMNAQLINADNGEFAFTDQVVSFKWNAFDESKPYYLAEYRVFTSNLDVKNYMISGIMFYDQNGTEQMEQFKDYVEVKADEKIEIPIAKTEVETKSVKIDSALNVNTKVENSVNISNQQKTGIEFRVQIKAVHGHKITAADIKKELIISENITEEFISPYYKYYAGSFDTYEEAKALKNRLRAENVPGAFVVAFKDGKRLENIQEAFDKSVVNNTSMVPSNQVTSDTIFKIQISASAKKQSIATIQKQLLKSKTEKVDEAIHKNMYKYLIGNYKTRQEALTKLSEIKKMVPDAFIVKYVNNQRL